MFDTVKVHECLDSLCTLNDAAKWSPQYLTRDMMQRIFSDKDPLSDGSRVREIIKGSVDKLLYAVINKKKIAETVKSELATFQLFDGRADFDQKNSNKGRFVGLRFNLRGNQNIVVKINKVSFQIDMPCPNLKLYLFDANQPQAVKVIETSYQQSRGVQTYALSKQDEIILADTTTEYYLGYFETDLAPGAQSIKKRLDYVNGPSGCSSCNQNNLTNQYYQARSKYVQVQPVYFDTPSLNGTELPNLDEVMEVNENNFGMNLQASVACDISDFICSLSYLIKEPLSLQIAVDLLNAIVTTSNVSGETEKAKTFITYQLGGDKEQYEQGLYAKLDKMIDALNVDISGINSVCLPCTKKATMRYTGI